MDEKNKGQSKKEKLFNFAKSVGNTAKNAAVSIGTGAKTAATSISETIKESNEEYSVKREQKKLEDDLKRYMPITEAELTSPDFTLPPIVRVVGHDIRRSLKACEGAVGFWTENNEVKILNIYKEHLGLLSIKLFPYEEEGVFYVDPCHKDLYIRIEEYFAYLKKMRVDELTTVAKELGAKQVEIVLKDKRANASSSSRNASSGFMKSISASVSISRAESQSMGVEVAAKIEFSGNETPKRPTLTYFKNERDIESLIDMRLAPDGENQIRRKTYSLQYGNSSGIKVTEAEKIDVAIVNLYGGASHSFSSEAITESNTVLEYTIEF